VPAYLIRKLLVRDSTLSQESQKLLVAGLQPPVTVKAGTVIVEQASRPGHSTLLVNGWASRYIELDDGRRQTLALHVSGDFVDLHSFPIKVMDHAVEAVTECSIAAIDHSALRAITERDAHLARLLWLLTLVDAAILRQWLVGATRRSALEHTAHLFCEIATRLRVIGLASPDQPFELPLSQQQLGEALGITPVHVSRTISALRNRNLVRWGGGQVQIMDWNALRDLARFDPTYLSLTDEPR
jgi:CRP-like cAMP-binding protein